MRSSNSWDHFHIRSAAHPSRFDWHGHEEVQHMKYVLITPARNEASNIERTITCVTAEIARKFTMEHGWIELVDMPQHRDRSFAAKAHCFNAGYDRIKSLDFDVI